jgi:hypothetical protein
MRVSGNCYSHNCCVASGANDRKSGRANISKLLSLGAAAIAIGAAGPAAAKDYECCRRNVTSVMLQCRFETLAPCQDMSFWRCGDCFRKPSLGSATNAYAFAPGVHKRDAYAPLRRK